MAGTTVTLAPQLFPIFCATRLLKHSAALHFEQSAVSADGDVGKITWFREMMAQVPKS
jgi:hypothetical protein